MSGIEDRRGGAMNVVNSRPEDHQQNEKKMKRA